MTANPEQASDLDVAVEAFLDAKQKGNDSGNYRALAATVCFFIYRLLSKLSHNYDIGCK